ncbi:MAG: hypothetical protein PW845_10100, partial [Pseudomonas sp.]|nr:hypothetical protein [Pseudomonas sp.]
MDDVTIDVDQRRTIVALLDQMRIPELVVERFAGHQTFPLITVFLCPGGVDRWSMAPWLVGVTL